MFPSTDCTAPNRMSRFSSLTPARVRWIIGALLLAAALLKASDASAPIERASRISDDRIRFAVIHIELILAAACFAGVAPKLVKRSLVALFAFFTAYSLYLVASGADSCGCFGPVRFPPWLTLALDIGVLALLFAWRPEYRGGGAVTPRGQWSFLLVVYAAAAVPASVLLMQNRSIALAGDAQSSDAAGIVILEPEAWKGKQLPIAKFIEIGDRVMTGKWILLLHHHNCPKCQETTPRYVETARRLQKARSATHVALIETPPFASAVLPEDLDAAAVLLGRQSDQREWFVQTPVQIKLDEGVVVDVNGDL